MSWNREALDEVLRVEVLPLVSKPNRYLGNELGLIEKDWDNTPVRFLLCYPDAYEVGMSHTGTQILYHIVNRNPNWLLDRVYAPWPDMEQQLHDREIPLWGLHYRRPVTDYDVLGFTLQSELTYTNLLNVLDLSGIPIRQADRREDDPLVCVGGPCASNPEPLAPFIDFALIGDAEDAIGEILERVEQWKDGRDGRREFLRRLATEVPGVYVPSLYTLEDGGRTTDEEGRAGRDGVEPITPSNLQPQTVVSRTVVPIDDSIPFPVVARKVPVLRDEDHPKQMVVSLTETTHDRLPVEVMRGCMRGCRFCQAGYLYRPARERDVEETLAIAEEGIAHSGWQEVSLLSLSTADYSQAVELTDRLSRTMVERGVGVSLPSLRADAFSVGLAEAVSRVRKSGFTFAPEAGSQRLRNVINKGIYEEDILSAVERAMEAGWTSVKLYFMIGHPTETEDDFEELAQLVEKIKDILKRYPGRRHITLGFSPFVPKAHTPFQWEQQDSFDTTKQKLAWIKRSLRGKGVEIRHHDTADTAIEGIISRGGREIADVIEGAWRKGARFDGWGEHCKFEYWQEALADNGLTLDQTFRERDEDEDLPWEIVSYKIPRSYFLKERHKAYAAAETEECKHERCSACGVCDFDAMHNILAPPADTPKPEAARGLLQGVPGTTVRLGYRKGEGVRFISHLDLMRELERTFRRAGLPMLYSEGFSPRPKMSAGAPLALGWTSDAEWLDIGLAGEWQEFELHELLDKLNASVAAGIEFTIAAALPPRQESLNAAVTRSTYIVRLPAPIFDTNLGDLEKAFTSLLDRESVIVDRVRRKKVQQLDVRPMIADASVVSDREIVITTVSYEGRMVKPTEIVAVALGIAEDRLPLLQVHKIGATTAAGDSPVERAVALAEVEQFETGNINYGHAAGNAGSYSGG